MAQMLTYHVQKPIKSKEMNRSYKFLNAINNINEDVSVFESWFGFGDPIFSKGNLKLYDPDHYDLIAKPHHLQRRLKEKEQQLSNYKSIIKHHEEIVKKIEEEITELKKQIETK